MNMRQFVTAIAVLLPSIAFAANSAPYTPPFQLRPAAAVSAVRADNVTAWSRDGVTNVTSLNASYRIAEHWAPFVRAMSVTNWPTTGKSGWVVGNPAVGLVSGWSLPADLRIAGSLAFTIPVGMGGGDAPAPEMTAARTAGGLARFAMDNSLFAVNELAIIPGIDVAWVAHGVTAQLEATVFHLTRVRGVDVTPDTSRTNLTTGLFLGYAFIPSLSGGVELRYQRWLTTPRAVQKDATLRDNLSAAIGVRGLISLSEDLKFRPGLVLARGLEGTLGTKGYTAVHVDLLLNY